MEIGKKIYKRLIRSYRNGLQGFKGSMGAYDRFYQAARGARILVYHGICAEHPTRFNSLFVTRQIFESHLHFYKKFFHVVSLDDFYAQRFRADRFNICISFDDGFANNYRYALPLLEKYKLPATFFVTGIREQGHPVLWNDVLTIGTAKGPQKIMFKGTVYHKTRRSYLSTETGTPLAELLRRQGFAEKKEMMELLAPYSPLQQDIPWDYWLQMTVGEIRQLSASPYATIGSHGYYHNDLARIPIEDIRSELTGSRQFLEEVTGKAVKAVAFPYGSYTAATLEEAKKAGYTQLLATEFCSEADRHDPLLKERMGINPYISLHNQLYANITGRYE